MSKYATKKATEQLQKIFDVLGEFGGVIETDDPRNRRRCKDYSNRSIF